MNYDSSLSQRFRFINETTIIFVLTNLIDSISIVLFLTLRRARSFTYITGPISDPYNENRKIEIFRFFSFIFNYTENITIFSEKSFFFFLNRCEINIKLTYSELEELIMGLFAHLL